MKCIVSKSGKTIDRVKDEVAHAKVATGKWSYTNKEAWKKLVRKSQKVEEVSVDNDKADEKVHGLKAKDRKNK